MTAIGGAVSDTAVWTWLFLLELTIPSIETHADPRPSAFRKELRHIVLFLRAWGSPAPIAKALKLLRTCTGLQKLDIVLDEQDFLARLTDKKKNQKYQDMMQVPGMSTLAEMRGLQVVNFHGNCDGLKAILEPLLLQPRGTARS